MYSYWIHGSLVNRDEVAEYLGLFYGMNAGEAIARVEAAADVCWSQTGNPSFMDYNCGVSLIRGVEGL